VVGLRQVPVARTVLAWSSRRRTVVFDGIRHPVACAPPGALTGSDVSRIRTPRCTSASDRGADRRGVRRAARRRDGSAPNRPGGCGGGWSPMRARYPHEFSGAAAADRDRRAWPPAGLLIGDERYPRWMLHQPWCGADADLRWTRRRAAVHLARPVGGPAIADRLSDVPGADVNPPGAGDLGGPPAPLHPVDAGRRAGAGRLARCRPTGGRRDYPLEPYSAEPVRGPRSRESRKSDCRGHLRRAC